MACYCCWSHHQVFCVSQGYHSTPTSALVIMSILLGLVWRGLDCVTLSVLLMDIPHTQYAHNFAFTLSLHDQFYLISMIKLPLFLWLLSLHWDNHMIVPVPLLCHHWWKIMSKKMIITAPYNKTHKKHKIPINRCTACEVIQKAWVKLTSYKLLHKTQNANCTGNVIGMWCTKWGREWYTEIKIECFYHQMSY